ncbi:hypothetical protein Syun_017477 [Stephania yunnanensis]|uniref:Uncharacterized protein n=1 Tax=Stephania yunnanensis TaxID=152371 RepID=A0AAP0P549_9MAGN
MPYYLPQVTCRAASRIGDSKHSTLPHVTLPWDKHVSSYNFLFTPAPRAHVDLFTTSYFSSPPIGNRHVVLHHHHATNHFFSSFSSSSISSGIMPVRSPRILAEFV